MLSPEALRRIIAAAAVAAACAVISMRSMADDHSGLWDVTLDNDMWVGETDRHYTHGTRISHLSDNVPAWVAGAAARLPCAACRNADTVEFVVGQSIFTPEDTWQTGVVEDDRPYAGWLYLSTRLGKNRDTVRGAVSSSLAFTVGAVGPASMAEQVQESVHRHRELEMPRGWDNQLGNELGFFADYERRWRRHVTQGPLFGLDVEPFVTGAVGTVHTHLGGGLAIRLGGGGRGLPTPIRQRGWSMFLEIEGRYVLRNLFLDGNTFTASHSVEKLPFVQEARAGLSFAFGPVEMRLAESFRSREFVGQFEPDRYGSLSFFYRN